MARVPQSTAIQTCSVSNSFATAKEYRAATIEWVKHKGCLIEKFTHPKETDAWHYDQPRTAYPPLAATCPRW